MSISLDNCLTNFDLDLLFGPASTEESVTSISENPNHGNNLSGSTDISLSYELKVAELQRDNATLKSTCGRLESENGKLKEEYNGLHDSFTKLASDYAELHKENRDSALSAISSSNKCEQMNNEVEIYKNNINRYKEQHNQFEWTNQGLQCHIRQLECLISELQKDVENSKKSIDLEKKNARSCRRMISTLNNDAETLRNHLCLYGCVIEGRKHLTKDIKSLLKRYCKKVSPDHKKSMEVEEDAGRGSSLAFSDSERSNFSPAFSNNFSPLSVCTSFTSESPKLTRNAASSPSHHNKAEIATSPIMFSAIKTSEIGSNTVKTFASFDSREEATNTPVSRSMCNVGTNTILIRTEPKTPMVSKNMCNVRTSPIHFEITEMKAPICTTEAGTNTSPSKDLFAEKPIECHEIGINAVLVQNDERPVATSTCDVGTNTISIRTEPKTPLASKYVQHVSTSPIHFENKTDVAALICTTEAGTNTSPSKDLCAVKPIETREIGINTVLVHNDETPLATSTCDVGTNTISIRTEPKTSLASEYMQHVSTSPIHFENLTDVAAPICTTEVGTNTSPSKDLYAVKPIESREIGINAVQKEDKSLAAPTCKVGTNTVSTLTDSINTCEKGTLASTMMCNVGTNTILVQNDVKKQSAKKIRDKATSPINIICGNITPIIKSNNNAASEDASFQSNDSSFASNDTSHEIDRTASSMSVFDSADFNHDTDVEAMSPVHISNTTGSVINSDCPTISNRIFDKLKDIECLQTSCSQDNSNDLEIQMILCKQRLDWDILSPMRLTPELEINKQNEVPEQKDNENSSNESAVSDKCSHIDKQNSVANVNKLIVNKQVIKQLNTPQNSMDDSKFKEFSLPVSQKTDMPTKTHATSPSNKKLRKLQKMFKNKFPNNKVKSTSKQHLKPKPTTISPENSCDQLLDSNNEKPMRNLGELKALPIQSKINEAVTQINEADVKKDHEKQSGPPTLSKPDSTAKDISKNVSIGTDSNSSEHRSKNNGELCMEVKFLSRVESIGVKDVKGSKEQNEPKTTPFLKPESRTREISKDLSKKSSTNYNSPVNSFNNKVELSMGVESPPKVASIPIKDIKGSKEQKLHVPKTTPFLLKPISKIQKISKNISIKPCTIYNSSGCSLKNKLKLSMEVVSPSRVESTKMEDIKGPKEQKFHNPKTTLFLEANSRTQESSTDNLKKPSTNYNSSECSLKNKLNMSMEVASPSRVESTIMKDAKGLKEFHVPKTTLFLESNSRTQESSSNNLKIPSTNSSENSLNNEAEFSPPRVGSIPLKGVNALNEQESHVKVLKPTLKTKTLLDTDMNIVTSRKRTIPTMQKTDIVNSLPSKSFETKPKLDKISMNDIQNNNDDCKPPVPKKMRISNIPATKAQLESPKEVNNQKRKLSDDAVSNNDSLLVQPQLYNNTNNSHSRSTKMDNIPATKARLESSKEVNNQKRKLSDDAVSNNDSLLIQPQLYNNTNKSHGRSTKMVNIPATKAQLESSKEVNNQKRKLSDDAVSNNDSLLIQPQLYNNTNKNHGRSTEMDNILATKAQLESSKEVNNQKRKLSDDAVSNNDNLLIQPQLYNDTNRSLDRSTEIDISSLQSRHQAGYDDFDMFTVDTNIKDKPDVNKDNITNENNHKAITAKRIKNSKHDVYYDDNNIPTNVSEDIADFEDDESYNMGKLSNNLLTISLNKYAASFNVFHIKNKDPHNALREKIGKKILDGIARCKACRQNEANYEAAMSNLITSLLNDGPNIAIGLVSYLKDPVHVKELKKIAKTRIPVKTESEEMVLNIIQGLQKSGVFILEETLDRIEMTLFTLERGATPSFELIESMSRCYAVICHAFRNASRLMLFMTNAMYCIAFKAMVIVKQCLDIFPTILPKAYSAPANFPFIRCFVFMLHFYKCEDPFKRVELLRIMLKKNYRYNLQDENETTILFMFKNAICRLSDHELERSMLRTCLIVLAKRRGTKWCHQNLVQKILLPMVKGETQVTNTARRFCITILGALLKPYKYEMIVHCEEVVNVLMKMLNEPQPQEMKEDILTSLICMDMQSTWVPVNNYLMNWTSPAPLSQKFEDVLKRYIRSKSIHKWRLFCTSEFRKQL